MKVLSSLSMSTKSSYSNNTESKHFTADDKVNKLFCNLNLIFKFTDYKNRLETPYVGRNSFVIMNTVVELI